jgi:alkyldihydroxyacetonephosphate synthase
MHFMDGEISGGGLPEETKKKVLEKLYLTLGPEKVSDREVDKIAYSKDYWPIALRWVLEKKTPALPDFIVWPESTQEVSEIVKIANEEKIPIVPFGEGSGVLGGAVPVNGGIVVDVKKMDKILEINDKNLTVTAQTGINLMNLERLLNKEGYILGHSPQSMYCSALGGNLSTRAAGHFSTKYGKIDDMVISLEAVLPTGEIIRSKNVPQSSTGPRVSRLLLGAEGTLGIITEVTLKIWPYPDKRILRSYAFENMEKGLEAVRNILRKGVFPAVVRLYDENETKRHFYATSQAKDRCMLILVMEGYGELADLERKVSEKLCEEHGGITCGEDPVNHWFETRFNVKETSEYAPRDIVFDTIEVTATWENSLSLYNSMISAMGKVDGTILATGHASHFYPQGVCFYFTFGGAAVKGKTPEQYYRSMWSAAMRTCLDSGGSISHHHGIGLMRAEWLKEELGEGGFEALKKIKHALDPENIMNPGKMGL